MKRAARATPDQLGVANDPQAHGIGSAVGAPYDETADEFPSGTVIPDRPTPGELMRWRGQQRHVPPPGPSTDAVGDNGQQPAVHLGGGRPDARRLWGARTPAGYSGTGAVGEAEPAPELSANIRTPEVVGPQTPPHRHRGGPTSEDPARPAMLSLAMYSRPFDEWAAAQFGALGRLEMDSPTATAPYTPVSDVPSREPSPGGGYAAPGIGPYAGAAPNSYRLLPRAWDELLINTGLVGETADTGRRAGGWRARG